MFTLSTDCYYYNSGATCTTGNSVRGNLSKKNDEFRNIYGDSIQANGRIGNSGINSWCKAQLTDIVLNDDYSGTMTMTVTGYGFYDNKTGNFYGSTPVSFTYNEDDDSFTITNSSIKATGKIGSSSVTSYAVATISSIELVL